ncbi:hypothetical protein MA16_Dca012729 [Dendrobium catenatum]|uniref:Uncharacterized protein n=1 Tax=Dendrobium catenatum TaxID=906689 RepID=A0A2I0V7L7_9ASPA|nr:hypothetical protein MA16_Dca012729 [Dendrobium catenatum]
MYVKQSNDVCCAEKEKENTIDPVGDRIIPLVLDPVADPVMAPSIFLTQCQEQEVSQFNIVAIDSLKVVANDSENNMVNDLNIMGNSHACIVDQYLTNANDVMNLIVEQENISLYVHLVGEEDENTNLTLEEGELSPIVFHKTPSAILMDSSLKVNDNWNDDDKFMEDDCSSLHMELANEALINVNFDLSNDLYGYIADGPTYCCSSTFILWSVKCNDSCVVAIFYDSILVFGLWTIPSLGVLVEVYVHELAEMDARLWELGHGRGGIEGDYKGNEFTGD